MSKIVLAIDSFKGCLTSRQAEAAAESGILSVCSNVMVEKIPVSDGGEGMLDAFSSALHATEVCLLVHDPLMRPVRSSYAVTSDGQTAVIEMAKASGLTLLSSEEQNPMRTTSYGTGELMADAFSRGCRHFIVGLGGSATCDGGIGMLQALGVRMTDARRQVVEGVGASLSSITDVDVSSLQPFLSSCDITIAADVTNPYAGIDGAAYVFAPQKGASSAMVQRLDEGLCHFAHLVESTFGMEMNVRTGGAAGGLGGALIAFLNAKACLGVELLLKLIDFDSALEGASLVITGEGHADCQTLMGKLPSGILDAARRHHIPVCLMAGKVDDRNLLVRAGFDEVIAVTPPHIPLDEAIKSEVASRHIAQAVSAFMRQ